MHKVWTRVLALAVLVLAMSPMGSVAGSSAQSSAKQDRWSAQELAVLSSLRLASLPAPPVDPSNAVERLPAAIELGHRLFDDSRLSRNGAVSCASCHDPKKQFQDGLPVGHGVVTGARRTMPIVGAGHGAWLFWDGRKDSLWSQALGPWEDAAEHGGNRTRFAHLMARDHRRAYEAIFGVMPDFKGLPEDASPNGTDAEKAAWGRMEARSREQVSRVFANMGKAVAAYEKSLRHEPSRLDRYIDGLVSAGAPAANILQQEEIRGLRLFIGRAQCVTCHNGPLFTDQQFHNTGVPPRDPARVDAGRSAATAKVLADEFNCLGAYSDAKPEQCQELRFMPSDDPSMLGAFKTPGLRDVARRPPYMHAGQFTTLDRVVRHYVDAPHAAIGHSELTHSHPPGPKTTHAERAPIELTEAEIRDLVAFLGSLSP